MEAEGGQRGIERLLVGRAGRGKWFIVTMGMLEVGAG